MSCKRCGEDDIRAFEHEDDSVCIGCTIIQEEMDEEIRQEAIDEERQAILDEENRPDDEEDEDYEEEWDEETREAYHHALDKND